MPQTRTIAQRLAAAEASVARLKGEQRKARTRRLIIAGSYLEPYLDAWLALTEDQRKRYAANFGKVITAPVPDALAK